MPFSLKILWAPLVDAFYIKKIGRRKTWVCGCLISVGILLLAISSYVHDLLDSNRERKSEGV